MFVSFSYLRAFPRKLWVPDAIFRRSPKSEKLQAVPLELYDERFYTIKSEQSKNGVFYYAASILVTTSCNMNFDDFPFDSQHCPVFLTSLRNSDSILWQVDSFSWLEDNFQSGEFHCYVDNATSGPRSGKSNVANVSHAIPPGPPLLTQSQYIQTAAVLQ